MTTPDSIQQLLESDNLGDRLQGLNQLRQLDTATAFELIQPLITDSHPRVRYAAVSQLDTLGVADLTLAAGLLRDRLLHDSEVDVQAAAADAIGGLRLTALFPELERLYYQTSEWLIQLSIIATLGELGEPESFDLLKEALNSDNDLVKTAAISALGELGNADAVPLIIPFADDPDWQVRWRVAQALISIGGEASQAVLASLAQDSVAQVADMAKNHL